MSVIVVAKKEFADQITSKRFIAFLIILLLVCIYSVYSGFFTSEREARNIFMAIATFGFNFIGSFLGLLVGFDLITKERESGSLKTLLSHPVFRDQVINGKALGAFGAFVIAVTLVTIITFGASLMKGFSTSMEDFVIAVKFIVVTSVYIFTMFSIGLFSSVIAKKSSTSLMIAFGIFLLVSFLMPFIGIMVAQSIVGPPPEVHYVETPDGSQGVEYNRIMDDYWERVRAITELFELLSPSNNYNRVVIDFLRPTEMYSFGARDTTKNIVGFILYPLVFFVLSYIKFLRSDIL
jgi:ABC-2 type transport system permease protein